MVKASCVLLEADVEDVLPKISGEIPNEHPENYLIRAKKV